MLFRLIQETTAQVATCGHDAYIKGLVTVVTVEGTVIVTLFWLLMKEIKERREAMEKSLARKRGE